MLVRLRPQWVWPRKNDEENLAISLMHIRGVVSPSDAVRP
jgi:hypothetical protein